MPVVHSLQRARARYTSHTALGEAIGLTGEEVGRVLAGKRGVSAEVAVRLAVLNGEDPLAALEAAGHQAFAALLREIYEPAGAPGLTRKERRLLDLFADLEPADLAHVIALVKRLPRRSK